MASRFILRSPAIRGPRTIRYRIVTLVLLILVPLMFILGWVAFDLARARTALIERERADITDRISAQIDREIATALGILTGLAATGDPAGTDPQEFAKQAKVILSRREFSRVWAFSPSGATLAEAEKPMAGLDADKLASHLFERVSKGPWAISAVEGEGRDSASVIVAVPLADGGGFAGGVAARLLVRELDRRLASVPMPSGWVSAVVDRNGRYLARSLDAEHRVSQLARPELKTAANATASSGTFENVTWEGVPMINSFRRSNLTDWTTVVAVPRDVVTGPQRRNTLLVLFVGTTALLLTLATAFSYATRISEPVRSLGAMAAALARGLPARTPRHPLAEFEELQKAFENAMAESAHLAALVASSGDAIMSMNLDGTVQTWNPAAERLFGYTSAEMVGRPKSTLVPPDAMADFRKQQRRVASGENIRTETVRCGRDGQRIAVSVDAAPIRRPDGTIIGTSSIIHDITSRIADEDHRRFLMREIAHRSKNQLAIIQAIATQTARGSASITEFLERFRSRLQGLSASHDLLLSEDWRGAPLEVLVQRQLEIFVGPSSTAVTIAGPRVMLHAGAAEAIGLAIHELATNSAKYGALSVPTGRVEIRWRELPSGDEPGRWELIWSEAGGPRVETPMDSGFGTQVVKRLAARAVDGHADLEYRPTGVYWRLEFPAAALQRGSTPASPPARPARATESESETA